MLRTTGAPDLLHRGGAAAPPRRHCRQSACYRWSGHQGGHVAVAEAARHFAERLFAASRYRLFHSIRTRLAAFRGILSRRPAFITAAKAAAKRLGCDVGNTSVCHFTAEDGGDRLHIVDTYGQLSIERITNQATPYHTGANSNTRQAQNNMIMATWTLASLAATARVEIETYASEYTLGDKTCFALLWKRIVNVPSMDSTVTARNIRTSLDRLPTEIPNLTIAAFNQKLTNLVTQLASRGETKDDLVTLILTAY